MSAAPKNRQPWPMKWIVVAIILFAVPYTILTLRYRKPGPAFQPYEDMKSRANVVRLLEAGYQRVPLTAQRPADGTRAAGGAAITNEAGGLPAELRSTLVEAPLLPTDIISVAAAPTANPLLAYSIHFTALLPTDNQQLGGAELYVRGEQLVIVPTFERVGGDLQTRSRQTVVLLTIPAGAVKAGKYAITLVGERSSRRWPVEFQ